MTTICIPRVFSTISEKQIRKVFQDINIGTINKITLIPSSNYNLVIINIKWNDTINSITTQKRLSNGLDIKVIYKEHWFWKASLYQGTFNEVKGSLIF